MSASQQQSDSTFATSSLPYLADAPPSPPSSSAALSDDDDDDSSDDYRTVWLRIWNNSSSPSQMSCRVAFDILWYCYSPANQVRTIYQTGSTDKCRRQREDVKLCGKIKLGRLTEQEARRALRASRDHFIVKEPHVWNWRTEPPPQFRRQQREEDTAGTAETPHQPQS